MVTSSKYCRGDSYVRKESNCQSSDGLSALSAQILWLRFKPTETEALG